MFSERLIRSISLFRKVSLIVVGIKFQRAKIRYPVSASPYVPRLVSSQSCSRRRCLACLLPPADRRWSLLRLPIRRPSSREKKLWPVSPSIGLSHRFSSTWTMNDNVFRMLKRCESNRSIHWIMTKLVESPASIREGQWRVETSKDAHN